MSCTSSTVIFSGIFICIINNILFGGDPILENLQGILQRRRQQRIGFSIGKFVLDILKNVSAGMISSVLVHPR